jgi:glycosyltransferase involved in cell wall biosynthesis
VNGWGGGIHRLDGSSLAYRRKGFELIVEAARLAPKLEFVVYSQEANAVRVPGNIEIRPAPIDNLALYQDGDVCVQPSHYEGLGLQLLECQAAGMPLVTTDAAPMNEYNPFRTIPVCGAEVITVGSGPISSQLMRPRDLVALLEPLVHTDIRESSRAAREFVVARHSWNAACGVLREALTKR